MLVWIYPVHKPNSFHDIHFYSSPLRPHHTPSPAPFTQTPWFTINPLCHDLQSRLKRQTSASQRLIRSARAKSLPGNITLPSSTDNGTGDAPSSNHQPLPAPVQSPSTSLPPQPPSPLRDDVFAGGQKKIHTLDGTITYKPSSVWEKACKVWFYFCFNGLPFCLSPFTVLN